MTVITATAAALLTSLLLFAAMRSLGPQRVPYTPARHRRRRTFSITPTWPRRPGRPTIEAAALAAWADALARSLRHGATLHSSIASVKSDDRVVEKHIRPLRHRLERGDTVRAACDAWANGFSHHRAHGSSMLTTLAMTLGVAAGVGGSAAAPIDRFAATMRRRVADDLEREANTAQARLSAHVLTGVPLAVLGLLLAVDDDVRRIVVEPSGRAVIGAGLALNATGAWWMRRIARPRSVR